MDDKNKIMQSGQEIEILINDKISFNGSLCVPSEAKGIVLFAHGSGSSRFSPRNRYIADMLQQNNLATLLIDLLTKQEEHIDIQTRELRFNIDLLKTRVIYTTKWLLTNSKTSRLNIGYFGASTGAAAALVAAAEFGEAIGAIVSRGGRTDLADDKLSSVKAPTLFIVGGYDYPVIDINECSLEKLQTKKKLVIIPGAGHLFEEPGKLEQVALFTVNWFVQHLSF